MSCIGASVALLLACASSPIAPGPTDAGAPVADGGAPMFDGGSPFADAGAAPVDAGAPTTGWLDLEPGDGPSPRRGLAVVADFDDRLLLLGGLEASTFRADVWALPLSGGPWSLVTAELSQRAPGGRSGAPAVFDPVARRVLWFGGEAHHVNSMVPRVEWFADLWALTLGDGGTNPWRFLGPFPNTPAARHYPALVYRADVDELLLVGGLAAGLPPSELSIDGGPGAPSDPTGTYAVADFAWRHTLRRPPPTSCNSAGDGAPPQWCGVSGGARPWPARWGAAFGYDPSTSALYLFGGAADVDAAALTADVWRFREAEGWARLSPDCDPQAGCPAPRYLTAGVYSAVSRALVLHGGLGARTDDGGVAGAPLGDTWAYEVDTNRWRRLPAHLPRADHAATLDARNRLIVSGGVPGAHDNRTAALPLSALLNR